MTDDNIIDFKNHKEMEQTLMRIHSTMLELHESAAKSIQQKLYMSALEMEPQELEDMMQSISALSESYRRLLGQET